MHVKQQTKLIYCKALCLLHVCVFVDQLIDGYMLETLWKLTIFHSIARHKEVTEGI